MDFTPDQLKVIRAKLGKNDGDELTPDEIAAAFAAAIQPGTVSVPDEAGMHLVDASVLSDWQRRAQAGDEAAARLRDHERDDVLGSAIRDGKFPQARLTHYQQLWDLDPEGTRTRVSALAAGVVPMDRPVGKPGFDPEMPGDFEAQAAYRQLYPEDAAPNGAGRHA